MNSEDNKKKRNSILIVLGIIIILLLFIWNEYLRFEFISPKTIVSYDGFFEMKLTKGWEETKKGKLNDDADIEIKNELKDIYLIAIMDDIDNTGLTFQEYVDTVLSSIEEGYKVQIPEVKKKDNYRYFDFEFKNGREEIYMCIYIVKTENYVGQIAIWSSVKNRDKVIEEIENSIIESINERK